MFKLRLLSAAIGIPLLIVVIVFGGVVGIAALAVLFSLLAAYELAVMANVDRMRWPLAALASIAPLAYTITLALKPTLIPVSTMWQYQDTLLCTYCGEFTQAFLYLFSPYLLPAQLITMAAGYPWDWLVIALLTVPALIFVAALAKRTIRIPQLRWLAPLFAAYLILLIPLSYGIAIWSTDGILLFMLAVLGSFASDTGGYFAGRYFGKHLLLPRVSPKKTWEGLVGSILLAVGATIAIDTWLLADKFGPLLSGVLGVLIALFGTGGDLFESYLKRKARVNDSGVAIPGHGGVLDRLDSILPNFLLVYVATGWKTWA